MSHNAISTPLSACTTAPARPRLCSVRSSRVVSSASVADLPEHERPDPGVERDEIAGPTAAIGFAPADVPSLGHDPHQQHFNAVARPAGEQRRRRPMVERNAKRNGLQAFDRRRRHSAPSCPRSAARRASIGALRFHRSRVCSIRDRSYPTNDLVAWCGRDAMLRPCSARSAFRIAGSGVLLGIATLPALAHSGSSAGGFIGGFAHPLFGPDHVVAMVAVGLWGAFLGAPAIWLLPIVFPLVMAIGGVHRHSRHPAACGRDRDRGIRRRARHDGGAGGAAAAVGRRRAGRHLRDLPRPCPRHRTADGSRRGRLFGRLRDRDRPACISPASRSGCWRAGRPAALRCARPAARSRSPGSPS